MGYKCIFVAKGGNIVSASDRERIGTVHAVGARIMDGEFFEQAVTETDAEASGWLMRQGLGIGIDFDGECHICFGITGPLEVVTPLARIVAFCVKSVLQAREVERTLAAQATLKSISASERLLEDMRIRASTDLMTGTWNRARFEDAAMNEIARFERYAHPATLIFTDIDHFKAINDSHGHLVGDQVLREFCDAVQTSIRSLDILGRWGGEEFVILMPNSTLAIGCVLAERIRAALTKRNFSPAAKVTASFGVAEYEPGETFASWLQRADTAMYEAKKNGRDRVIVAGHHYDTTYEHVGKSFVRLVWHERYACGNDAIDHQHKNLFSKANILLDAVLGAMPKDEILALIDLLIEDIALHFGFEEYILEKSLFPDLALHKTLHQELLSKAVSLRAGIKADELVLGGLFSFLSYDVIAVHMLSEDRKFFPFLLSEEKLELANRFGR
jgi:diguanylate cyclase (GGDEF)-like protein/hemerythrin-like metal-binding protein